MFPTLTREAITPTVVDAQIARESSTLLTPLLNDYSDSAPHMLLRTKDHGEADIRLPASVLHVILDALLETAKGNSVALQPIQTELTAQQTADMMRVSRPSLIKMLNDGKLPYRKVGAHRRILYGDVMRYLEIEHARRTKVMEELVAETQRLGLY